jgi:hypothetical protein
MISGNKIDTATYGVQFIESSGDPRLQVFGNTVSNCTTGIRASTDIAGAGVYKISDNQLFSCDLSIESRVGQLTQLSVITDNVCDGSASRDIWIHGSSSIANVSMRFVVTGNVCGGSTGTGSIKISYRTGSVDTALPAGTRAARQYVGAETSYDSATNVFTYGDGVAMHQNVATLVTP